MTEEIKRQVMFDISSYLKENIEDFDLRARLALNRMDRNCAPLYNVDYALHDEMTEYTQKYLWNEIDIEDLLDADIEGPTPSIFDIINSLSKFTEIVKGIAEMVREDQPEAAGYLDEAVQHFGGSYIALNNYLEELR